MAELKCAAENCVYNKSEYCCKGDIMVGGKHADCEEDTCCESFADAKNDRFTSAIEHPSKVISIDCEAVDCTYNKNYRCAASHVDIIGSRANDSRETACGTFKEK